MRTFRKLLLILVFALALELGVIVTLSSVEGLEQQYQRTVQHSVVDVDCSLLSGHFPEPRINVFQPSDDVDLGKESFSLLRSTTALYPKEVALLQSIYTTLKPHLPDYAKRSSYTFYIGKGLDVNAYSLGGGIIVVSEGLIAESPSVDFLAHVVAHEVGHDGMRHLSHKKSMQVLLLSEIELILTAMRNEPEGEQRQKLELLYRARVNEYFGGYPSLSYELEMEADIFASYVIARAGYDLSVVAQYYDARGIERKETRGSSDGNVHPPSKLRALILRCTDAKPIVRPQLEDALAKARGAIVARHSLERKGVLK
jgi:predicted Zn-dependent protease